MFHAQSTSAVVIMRAKLEIQHVDTLPKASHHPLPGAVLQAQKEKAPDNFASKDQKGPSSNQTYVGTVSKAALGKLLRDGMGRIILWAFPSE